MLPHKRIGKPKEDYWLGLLDGIYAISLTLLVLELPNILKESFALFEGQNLINTAIPTFIVIANGLFNYIFIFFILYEFWCFHRASIKLTCLQKRWQNLFNSFLLANICLLPVTKYFVLTEELQTISNKAYELNERNIWKFFFEYLNTTPGIHLVYIQCIFFFITLILLLSKTKDNKSLDIKHIKNESKKRILIFLSLFTFHYVLTLPLNLINICYLLYSNYERKPYQNE